MTNLLSLVSGYKTYILGLIGSIIVLLMAFGVITLTTNQILAVAFLFANLFAITFRDALNSMTLPVVGSKK